MKKLLFICDVNNFSSGAFSFLEDLYKNVPFLLTGAFFHSVNLDVLMPTALAFSADPLVAYTDSDVEAVNSSIRQFEQKCQHNGFEYRVHEESECFKLKDVVRETRFSDAVVISEKLFFSHIEAEQPNSYMKELLHTSECPVIVIPEDYSPIAQVTIAYDGKKESVFAIKQFCYLFPHYTHLPTEIVYWVDKTDDEIPNLEYLEEFAARHFDNLNFKELFFDRKKYIAGWSRKNRNTIFVSGSYKRSWFSTLFKESFVDDMIKNGSPNIFIAHNR
jgi:hypothetical protein